MRTIAKRVRRTAAKRPTRKKTQAVTGAREFLRRTFYYLKGEQYLKASRRLLCETA